MGISEVRLKNYQLGKRTAIASIALILLFILFYNFLVQFAELLRPIIVLAISGFGDLYSLTSLDIKLTGREHVFFFNATTAEIREFPRQTIPAGIVVSSSTLVAHAIQPFLVCATLMCFLPYQNYKDFLIILALCPIISTLVVSIDVPVVLIGALEDLFLSKLDQEAHATSLIVNSMNLFNSGGRLVLPAFLLVGTFLVLSKHHSFNQTGEK